MNHQKSSHTSDSPWSNALSMIKDGYAEESALSNTPKSLWSTPVLVSLSSDDINGGKGNGAENSKKSFS